ncbi:MAG: DUF5690 family protein, partial [Rikenellaceae bacterium]|nr:DUF5690 family protein [Rikenellaceae bacterium]
MAAAFLTYLSMYAFRKPLSAATFEGLVFWGIDYKIIAITSQLVGYTASKFIGIKVVSGLTPQVRKKRIMAFIGIAWVALLMFALIPAPYNIIFLVLNGLPLGMIWGIVFSFLEGRKNTELLGAGMCVSFITASGITKSVGRGLIIGFGLPDTWMPFCVGMLFIPVLLLGTWMLGKIPPPTAEDKALRTERVPMSRGKRRAFFRTFSRGIVMSTVIYATLTVYRDLRNNFAVEIWTQLGYGDNAGILAMSEIPIAVCVLLITASMIKITDNRRAFFGNLSIFIIGGLILLGTTLLFTSGNLPPAVWMISSGFGLYLCYVCFHTMFFERWIALFRYRSNIGFLIYIADSFGYLGSVDVMLYKNFFSREIDWLSFV